MNSDQLDAKSHITDFIKDKNRKVFVLSGHPGTGKTYLITELLKDPKFNKLKIVFTAPTNKAVSVLQNMTKITSKKTDFITIHKLLKIKRMIDSSGNEKFIINIDDSPSNSSWKSIYYYDLIVIDEASMINETMYHQLIKCSKNIKGNLIFLGDVLQLPPVNEDISKVFNNVDFTLTKVIRNKNNILTLCNRVRENIIDSSKRIRFKELADSKFTIFKDHNEWIDTYCRLFKEDKNPIVLAYTNKCCINTNNKIRKKLFNCSEKYTPGELIVFNGYYKTGDTSFYTSQQCKITNVETVEHQFRPIDFSKIINLKITLKKNIFDTVKTINPKNIDKAILCPICYEEKIDEMKQPLCGHRFCTACLKLWLSKHDTCPMCRFNISSANTFEIKNDKALTEKINNLNTIITKSIKVWKITVDSEIVKVIHEDSLQEYEKLIETIKKILINIKKHIGNCRTNETILIRLWQYIYTHMIDHFADISYGYCITTHKSQGSTYPYVFVDSKNILGFNNNDSSKCFYTAISRTSEYLALYY